MDAWSCTETHHTKCQRSPGGWRDASQNVRMCLRAVKPHCSYEDPVTPRHDCCCERHWPGRYPANSTRINTARVPRKIPLTTLEARLIDRETCRARRITP